MTQRYRVQQNIQLRFNPVQMRYQVDTKSSNMHKHAKTEKVLAGKNEVCLLNGILVLFNNGMSHVTQVFPLSIYIIRFSFCRFSRIYYYGCLFSSNSNGK